MDSEIIQVLHLRARHEIQGGGTTKAENLERPVSAQTNLHRLLPTRSLKQASKTKVPDRIGVLTSDDSEVAEFPVLFSKFRGPPPLCQPLRKPISASPLARRDHQSPLCEPQKAFVVALTRDQIVPPLSLCFSQRPLGLWLQPATKAFVLPF